MDLIEATVPGQGKVMINPVVIAYFLADGPECVIHFLGGTSLAVLESYEDITRMIDPEGRSMGLA